MKKKRVFQNIKMDGLAIILVLSAALVHPLWNLLAKRAGVVVVFIWLFASLSAVIYAPVSGYILWNTRPKNGFMGLSLIFTLWASLSATTQQVGRAGDFHMLR